jgi:hypothetical protein
MRRAPRWGGIVGVVLVWALGPAVGRAGVWVTLAAGLDGTTTAANEFWFDTPHGPPQVAVNQLSPGFTAEAGTGGGTTFFSSAATPLLLNLSDGSAYVAAGTAPDAAKVPGGSRGGTGATAAPLSGQQIPTDAALLGITLSQPDTSGKSSLTATVTETGGKTLGSGTVDIPNGGWWVIGLAPGDKPGGGGDPGPGPVDPPPPPPVNPPPPEPPPPVPPPPVPPPPVPPGNGHSSNPTTPEPSTMVLVGLGAGFAGAWSRLRRKG